MKKFLALMLALVMCLSLVACGGGGNDAAADAGDEAKDDYKLVLKMSHVFAPTEALTLTMDEICKNVTEKTGGAIEIQHFPQSQLPVYKDGLEQVVQGAHFISVEDPSYVGDYVPDFNVLAGPMLVTSYDQYVYLTKSAEVQDMLAKAAEKGIHVINIDYIFGFRSMMTNKLIETPEDMKGLKIRTPGSELYVNTINCMGATATPMGFADTISAVQQGVVDGLEGTIDAYNSNGSAEVAKQMALTKHLLGVCGAYINEDLWNSIPEEYRTIMQEEFDAGAERMVKKITESEAEIMKKLEAEKGITFNEVDSEAFKALVLPIYEEMVAKKGVTPGLYERFQEIIAEMP